MIPLWVSQKKVVERQEKNQPAKSPKATLMGDSSLCQKGTLIIRYRDLKYGKIAQQVKTLAIKHEFNPRSPLGGKRELTFKSST